jgi:hypothetical protein
MHRIFLFLFLLGLPLDHVISQGYIYPYLEDGKIGFKDEKDSVVVMPVYDYYEPFQEGQEWTVVGKGIYERLSNSASERQVKFTGKFGLISSSGVEIFEPEFDMVFAVSGDYARVGMGEGSLKYDNWPEGKGISFTGKMGIIHRNGYQSLPFEYPEIKSVTDGDHLFWFAVDDQDRSYLYRDSIKLAMPDKVSEISNFSEGLAKIQVKDKFGFIDRSGKVVVPPQYDRATDFSDGQTFVKLGDEYAWIDANGLVIPDKHSIFFDELGEFSDGCARVRVFDEYGFIRPDSSFLIFPRFKEATPFFNHLASVSDGDSFGYVFTDSSEDLVPLYMDNKIRITPGAFKDLQIPQDTFPSVNWDDSVYFFNPFDTLSLEKLISFHSEALRWAPYLYFNYPQMLPKVSAGEGTLAGRFLFNLPFLTPGDETWEYVKRNLLLSILRNEKMRSLIWKLAKPYYRSAFQSMPKLHQEVYREMIDYLEGYYEKYDIETIRSYLTRSESFFAYEHPDGTTSPFRKASAQIDRLILTYEVISVEDTQRWIRKIKKDMSKW